MTSKPKPARRPKPSTPPRLRLVKVIVQPIFVLDHGTHIQEIDHQPVAIPATDWPTYSNQRFPREVAAWQRQLLKERDT